jgi:hypothetical protein
MARNVSRCEAGGIVARVSAGGDLYAEARRSMAMQAANRRDGSPFPKADTY